MLKYLKNNRYSYAFLFQLSILIISIFSLFIPNYSYSVPRMDMTPYLTGENVFTTEPLNLTWGRYIVHVNYYTRESITINPSETTENVFAGFIMSDGAYASAAYSETSFEVWVLAGQKNVSFDFTTGALAHSNVYVVTVEKTRFGRYCFILVWVIICCLTSFHARILTKKIKMNKERYIVITVVTVIGILASIPIFNGTLPGGNEMAYNLTRIEGLKDGMLSGQFPVRIEPTYLNGYGYAVSTFTGGLFFYIPAFLRIMGFNLQFCYKLFLLLINFAIAITSYRFFTYVFKRYQYGLLGAGLYTLSVFVFGNIYCLGAVDEALALAIMPALGTAFWKIYEKDIDEKYSIRWVPLTIAFSCLLETHLISAEIAGITMLIICICNAKRTFRQATIIVLLKFVFATIFINLSFLMPFMDNMLHYSYRVNTWRGFGTAIQSTGQTTLDYFTYQLPVYNTDNWLFNTFKVIPGPAFAFGIIVSTACLILFRKKDDEKRATVFWCVSSLIFLIITSSYFPWDSILIACQRRTNVFTTTVGNLISNVEYLYRLYTVGLLCFTGMIINGIRRIIFTNNKVKMAAYIVLCTIITSQYFMLVNASLITQKKNDLHALTVSIYDSNINKQIGSEYYMPKTVFPITKDSVVFNDYSVSAVNASVYNLKKNGTNLSFSVFTTTDKEGWIEIPLLYYVGYQVYDSISGKEIVTFKGNMGRICFVMPGNTQYDVVVNYTGKPIWQQCDLISLITLLSLLGFYFSSLYKLYYKESRVKQK